MSTRVFIGCLLILTLPFLANVGIPASEPAIGEIPFAALTALIDSDVPHLLVDTRASLPYRLGHIPTAVSIPGYLFDRNDTPGLPENRDIPIVTYCKGGNCGISWHAAERMIDLGYRRVMVFNEGVQGWKAHGQMLITPRHEKLPRIEKSDLAALLATGAIVRLLDARGEAEFQTGTIAGAVNLPVQRCRPGQTGMPPSADELVVVFGQGKWDGRPYHVADRLRAWGYRKVRLFVGGLALWRK